MGKKTKDSTTHTAEARENPVGKANSQAHTTAWVKQLNGHDELVEALLSRIPEATGTDLGNLGLNAIMHDIWSVSVIGKRSLPTFPNSKYRESSTDMKVKSHMAKAESGIDNGSLETRVRIMLGTLGIRGAVEHLNNIFRDEGFHFTDRDLAQHECHQT